MKRIKRMSLGIAGATAAAALLSVAVLSGAQAAQVTGTAAAAASPPVNSGIPVFVNPAADLAAQPGQVGGDSIYVTSRVKGGGHDYGIMVYVLKNPGAPQHMVVSVSDETTGWYKNYGAALPSGAWGTKKLDIKAPGLTWAGSAQHMTIRVTTPWGAIGLQLTNHGPALNDGGNGLIQVFGSTNHQYALPYLSAAGTLTIGGKTTAVAGGAWLDRQWGPLSFTPTAHWTWMNISLSNGDRVSIWDDLTSTSESSWATVLHPDGSYELATVTPVAGEASGFWKSPVSGNTYPSRWRITIPSLNSRLQVAITGTDDQELVSATGGMVEATAAVTGSFEGEGVTGVTYAEMIGNWKA